MAQQVENRIVYKKLPCLHQFRFMQSVKTCICLFSLTGCKRGVPDYDVTVRGAVSIGRRAMDPLAELVKIDPKSLASTISA